MLTHPINQPTSDQLRKAAGERTELPVAQPHLGPAKLLERDLDGLRVELEDGTIAEAELALGYAFTPTLGDTLLVLGLGERHYVVGVLQSEGINQLAVEGDLDVRSNGKLRLFAEGIELEGREVTIRARTLRTFADTLEETATDAYRWVKGLLTVRAGESRRVIEGDDITRAKTASILAEEVVTLDGDRVDLGH